MFIIYQIFIYTYIEFAILIFWLLSHTFLHELCHYFTAKSYIKDTEGIILLQSRKNKKILIKTKDLTIVKTDLLCCRGLTLLNDNYGSFTERQLKIIAIMPRIIQIVYFLIMELAITILANCILSGFLFVFIIFNSIFTLFVIIFSLRKGTSKWNDVNIFINPAGYKEHIKTSLSEDETYNYWRTKLCI